MKKEKILELYLVILFALENISYPRLIDYKYGDITIPSSLPPVLQDAQAIIFSVNSKKTNQK